MVSILIHSEIGDAVFEALFRQAVIDDYVEEIQSIPPNEVLAKEYTLSPAFELRMKRLFALDRRKDIYRALIKYTKKVAVFLLILISLFFSVLLFNPEIRAAVRKVVIEWYEQFTSFSFNGEISQNKPDILRPIYIPEGYAEDSVKTYNNITDIIFINDAKEQIRYSYRSGENTVNISSDNENHIINEITINGRTAIVMNELRESSNNGVIYQYNGYVIEIWGKIEVDEILKMIESISDAK